jgi:hypothetical protein
MIQVLNFAYLCKTYNGSEVILPLNKLAGVKSVDPFQYRSKNDLNGVLINSPWSNDQEVSK